MVCHDSQHLTFTSDVVLLASLRVWDGINKTPLCLRCERRACATVLVVISWSPGHRMHFRNAAGDSLDARASGLPAFVEHFPTIGDKDGDGDVGCFQGLTGETRGP